MLFSLAGRVATSSGAVGISLCVLFGCALVGCGGDAPRYASEGMGQNSEPFVNGGDDRLEYFELAEPAQRAALERFTVALMTDNTAAAVASGHVGVLPTWGQLSRLCDGEPFVDQPVAAFCSGVLVDYDLVLTSGHCVDVIPLENLRIAFDYFYRDTGAIALNEGDLYEVERVVVSRRDEAPPEATSERLDFAWLQLKKPAQPPHQPAPIFTRSRGAAPNEPVISIGAGGGVPIKWDEGGHVQNTRSNVDDYFIADTDTSQGSSGGGIFDTELALLGNLARGAPDFERTDAGCFVTSSQADPAAAQEQFTYAHRAVEALCATGSRSVLCDSTCTEPCQAAAFAVDVESETEADDSGCAFAPRTSPNPGAEAARGSLGLALALGASALLRRRSRPLRVRTRHELGA
jgi:Trypsin-like peptidase domain